MELQHIALDRLAVSAANMRGKGRTPDLSNILPSVRARGILVPLIVRSMGEGDGFEIIAGRRRYEAAKRVAEECGESDPLPCAIMAAGDDAAALEASLIENIARLDPDEVTRWETFTRLVREGRTPESIALTFGLTPVQVTRTLALGNLLPRIRSLYRAGTIDAVTLRHLTLANKVRQREWLALLDGETHAPTGAALKAWLFGGASIPTKAALFDLTDYPGEIVTDLFGDDSWFASASDFWTAQRAEVEKRAEAYRDAGWSEVVLLAEGQAFQSWEHERCPKRKGGRVYVSIGHRGDVAFHEGYITTKEARRRERGEETKATRPELTNATASYVDLHRHAVVRATLASRPMVALRVMVAHAIVGSPLWRVGIEPQRAPSDAIAESVESSSAEASFDGKRRAVLALLGLDPDAPTVAHGHADDHGVTGLFLRLCALSHTEVLDILAVVMGETLDVGTTLIEALGVHLDIDIADHWRADAALLDGIRDKAVLNALLAEVAGDTVAQANRKAAGKVQRGIIADCLAGTNSRQKVERWVPRWMAFPPSAYGERGNVPTAARWVAIEALMAPEPDAEPQITAPVATLLAA